MKLVQVGALVVLAFCCMADAACARPGNRERPPLRETWPANDLERLLVSAANDESVRPSFLRALLNAQVCAMAGKPDDGGNISLLEVNAPDGQPATPIFTSPERAIETFGKDTQLTCGTGAKLLEAVRGRRVVLDPGQPFGTIWTPDDLDHILGHQLTLSEPLELKVPVSTPPGLVDLLEATLKSQPRISGAWLAIRYSVQQKNSSWYLDVRTDLEPEQIHVLVRDALLGVNLDGLPLDIAVRSGDAPPGCCIEIIRR